MDSSYTSILTLMHREYKQYRFFLSRVFFFPDLSVNTTCLSFHIWKGAPSGNRNTLPTNGEQGGSVVIIPPVSFSGSAWACMTWIGARPKTNSATVFLGAGGRDCAILHVLLCLFYGSAYPQAPFHTAMTLGVGQL